MPINTPAPQTPEGIIRNRLRLHGFANEHAVLLARAIVFAHQSPMFQEQVGAFGIELLREAIDAFGTEGV